MCGIAGIIGAGSRSTLRLQGMADALAHRGPDDDGIWQNAEAPVGFAFRRLSIVDLSPMGHQPMHSADGRLTIAFNGEIYNHRALRTELDARKRTAWRGHSDTETLIEGIAEWGLEATLKRCVGMFAIALWDHRQRVLSLARDRFGEKPLYYGWAAGNFVFASELKAISSLSGFANPVDRRAVQLLVARAYIPAPFSVYQRLFKLEPATILTVTLEAVRSPRDEAPRTGGRADGMTLISYWSYRETLLDGLADPFASEAEALDALEHALAASIDGQAVADVPVGAFLSGGIDSSTVVALYQRRFPGQVKTFSIGFAEGGYDEAVHARAIARHFGTEHHEHYVGVAEAQAVIPQLPTMFDEPFADSSQIPTHLVSRLARQHVSVALSGDGGDELFGGYNRYLATARLWQMLRRLPRPLRRAIGGSLHAIPPALWNRVIALAPAGRRPAHFGFRVNELLEAVRDARSLSDVVTKFLNEWSGADSPVLGAGPLPETAGFAMDLPGAPDESRMMFCDALSYLPDDILCKVDRAAMAVSLETRVPFLDHRLAAVAARIPLAMKIQGTTGKTILRRLLYRHAPPALFDRPKAGFTVPIGGWIKGPLREWAESLLDPKNMAEQGLFDSAQVQRRWHDHLSGERESTQAIWTVLMFQAWLSTNRETLVGF